MNGQNLYNNPLTQVDQTPPGPLMTPPNGVAISLELDEILSATCKAAVELLKVDHSGLMVFDSEPWCARVISEYPPIGTKGLTLPWRGVPAEEQMVTFKQPILVPDVLQDSS